MCTSHSKCSDWNHQQPPCLIAPYFSECHCWQFCHLGHKPQGLPWLFLLLHPYAYDSYLLNTFQSVLFCLSHFDSQRLSPYLTIIQIIINAPCIDCPISPVLTPSNPFSTLSLQFSRTSILSCHTPAYILNGFQTSCNEIKILILL